MWYSRPGMTDWTMFCEFVRMVMSMDPDGVVVYRGKTAGDFPLVEPWARERAAALWNAAWGGVPVPVRGGRFVYVEADKVSMPWASVKLAMGVMSGDHDVNPREGRDQSYHAQKQGIIACMTLREVCAWYGLEMALRECAIRHSEGEDRAPRTRRTPRPKLRRDTTVKRAFEKKAIREYEEAAAAAGRELDPDWWARIIEGWVGLNIEHEKTLGRPLTAHMKDQTLEWWIAGVDGPDVAREGAKR